MMRAQAGIALVTVVVVLVGLAVIATPFALSMRGMESAALLAQQQETARAGALAALALARQHLTGTHPAFDVQTPHRDDRAELQPGPAGADLTPRDPRGSVRSVVVQDEQGKVHLGTASAYLLGNLLGGRTVLTADADERSDVLAVASTAGFPPAGLAWLGLELVEYSSTDDGSLGECRRGFPSANLLRSQALPHRAGEDVLDLRLMLLAQHGWRIRPGIFDGFRRVEGLQDIGLYGELTYSADELERVRSWFTVHGSGPRWVDPQRVLRTGASRRRGFELHVPDGARYGPGTVVQLEHEEAPNGWSLVLSAVDHGDHWRLELLEPPQGPFGDGRGVVRALSPEPVNVNTCSLPVLEALLTGLGRAPVADVVTEQEAVVLAEVLADLDPRDGSGGLPPYLRELVQDGQFSLLDFTTAALHLEAAGLRPGRLTQAELAALLVGLEARRAVGRLGPATARRLAGRIRAALPGSHEDLRRVLDAAVQAGTCRPHERDVLLRNALHPGDARITGGTAPFTYGSGGVFSLLAASSENAPNGRELARAFVREVLSPGLSGETARRFASQADFEAARFEDRGWTSRPQLLLSGPGAGRAPTPLELGGLLAGGRPDDEALVDLVERFSGALGLGPRGADRAGTLLAGRPGPWREEAGSFLGPAPVRETLADTLHFDEGLAGMVGSSPEGFSFGDGAVTLPLDGLRPGLLSPGGLLRTFTVSFWFELDDADAATLLFDGGADELEDRVVLQMSERELIFRVCDTGIPDFEASMPTGRAPPTGEIRYAFDDGLALLPGVPYHVLAWVGGASGRNMALFVDGVPRGQRPYRTFLTEDLDAAGSVGAGVASYSGDARVRVDDTSGFPRQGVLRVGSEILEYVDLEERAFLVRPAGSEDPFGGRARRNTAAQEHPASETVELLGYTTPLASERAARGLGSLLSRLDRGGVAELDPGRLGNDIVAQVTTDSGDVLEVTLGTGLSADEGSLPLRASGSVPLEAGTFQDSGGHALLFCDYGGGSVVGNSFSDPADPSNTWLLPPRTINGWLGGAEVIHYSGFDGSTLTGVSRASEGVPSSVGPSPSDLLGTPQVRLVRQGSTSWQVSREFVTTFDSAILGGGTGIPENPRVLVIPISVGVAGGDLWEEYHPGSQELFLEQPGLLQVGLDFDPGDDATEWLRWDTATSSLLVRDDGQAVNDLLRVLAGAGVWNPDSADVSQDLLDAMNGALRFRGQDGTRDGAHAGGETALPVHVLGGWGTDFAVAAGRPGRNDAVTLVAPEGDKEWHRINHASLSDRDWTGYALVGLRDPVLGEFLRTDPEQERNLDFDPRVLDEALPADSPFRDALQALQMDSRLITRLLKAPSGELPAVAPEAFRLGADYLARASAGVARVDELRFTLPSTPGPLLPAQARYVLAEDLAFDQTEALELATSSLLYPHALMRDPLLGADALEVLSELPQAGGLLLVGDEILAYAGLDPTDTGAVFLTSRGLYGSRAAFHRRGEPVLPLLFWPCSPLASRLSDSAAVIPVADPDAFPPQGGLVWIDKELLAYTGVEDGGLLMPARAGSNRLAREGLLRGRFGTAPAEHAAGAVVRYQPRRFADRALLGHDVPEAERLRIPVRAAGAFYTDVALRVFLADPSLSLTLRAVTDGRASPHDQPASSQHLSSFQASGVGELQLAWPLARQGDELDLYLFARWAPGAFDPVQFTAQGWKLIPEVRSVVIGHVQPTRVLEHEEWR